MVMEGMELDRIIAELILLAGTVFSLVVGIFLPRGKQWLIAIATGITLTAALVATLLTLGRPDDFVFSGTYLADSAGAAARAVLLFSALLVTILSFPELRNHKRETEYYVLLLFGTLGLVLLTGTSDLMLLVVAYLLSSIPLYTLTAFFKDDPGTEAAMKYLLMGALLGIVMLYGLAFLYGAGGATTYRELTQGLTSGVFGAVALGIGLSAAGLFFNLGCVPAHFWVPDVTEGAPVPVAAFVTTVPKLAALIALSRLLLEVVPETLNWPLFLAIIAALTMTLGNLGALWQQSPLRLLAYSTISQVGYLLMAVVALESLHLTAPAAEALFFYILAYAAMNLGAFAVVAALPDATTLEDYADLFRHHPTLALSLTLCLLSLIGIPPLAGFVAKLGVFTAAWNAGFAWLTVLAAINTVISIYYYLRWLLPVYLADSPEKPLPIIPWAHLLALFLAIATIAIGIAAPALLF